MELSIAHMKSRKSKRNNSYCCYEDNIGNTSFGKIELTSTTQPSALIRQLKPLQTTLMTMAGHPCRTSLNSYQDADLLSSFITPVDLSTDLNQLLAVPIDSIVSKAVLISVSGYHYCIIQPNNIERH